MYHKLKLFVEANNRFAKLEPRTKFIRDRIRRKLAIREQSMPENIDWPSVWPVAKTFVPSAVPLPLRQSYQEKGVSRGKFSNTELLKVQNFLHITPPAIERHCQAIKKFCTPWPDGLDSDEEIRRHFPITKISRDYVHASPSIREPRARIVDLVVNIEDLKLAREDEIKIIKLADHRYDEKTGNITITASACPTKTQNQDYADYLLTALYFESIDRSKAPIASSLP